MTTSVDGRASQLRYQLSLDCIHCGLCLSVCPTYKATGDEAASPRGRIYLMRGLAEERLEPTESFAEKMDLCLLCRACESICPSAVRFGSMMETTRAELRRTRGASRWRTFFLRRVLPSRRWIGGVAGLSRFYVRSGLQGLARRWSLLRLLPEGLRRLEANLPDVPERARRRPLPETTPPAPGSRPRGRVAVFEGCVMPALFGDINRRLVEVLAAQGYEVVSPRSQTCCGALHAHEGDLEFARRLASQNIDAFLAADIDHIVLDSAGCGAALRDYLHWIDDSEQAAAFSAKVIDVLELFERERLEPRGTGKRLRVAYDAPCHLHHAQGVTTAPLAVLSRIPNVELVALPGAEDCCGAAGIYNLTHPEMSAAVLAPKLDALAALDVDVLVTGNPGCLMQWQKGISERGLAVRVAHPVELL